MIISVNSQRLASELRLLNKIVPNKPVLAILSHVLLRADSQLHLYATDIEVGLSTDCAARIEALGSVALPAGRLLALVERFPDDDVTIAVASGSQVVVKCGAHTSRLQAMSVQDFPQPATVEGTSCTLDAVAFRRLIERTRYAVIPMGSKVVLQGALLTLAGPVAAMVATDGKRLALSTMNREGVDQRIIIPAKTLDIIASLAETGDVELTVGPRHLFFTLGGRLLTSRTIDGEYPKYERIIPRDNDKVVTIDRASLSSALRRVALASEETHAVYFSIAQNVMELTAASAEVGSSNESLRAGYEGDPLKICVNGDYVLDFLQAASHPTISLAVKDANSPALLTDGNDHVGVVMLMRA